MSGRLIDATSILPCEFEAQPVKRCDIAQLNVKEKNAAIHIAQVLVFCSQHLPGVLTGERALRVRFGTSE
jgi:hypothetical protein